MGHEDDWPPPEARYRSALWRAERHIGLGEWIRASDALEDVLGLGDDELVRGLLHLVAAGHKGSEGDQERALKQLDRARRRLAPYLPEQEEVDLTALIELVQREAES